MFGFKRNAREAQAQQEELLEILSSTNRICDQFIADFVAAIQELAEPHSIHNPVTSTEVQTAFVQSRARISIALWAREFFEASRNVGESVEGSGQSALIPWLIERRAATERELRKQVQALIGSSPAGQVVLGGFLNVARSGAEAQGAMLHRVRASGALNDQVASAPRPAAIAA